MKKLPKIGSLSKLKRVYPCLYDEIEEFFNLSEKKLSHFEMDYFHYNETDYKFYLTLSSKVLDEFEIFDMYGEMIDDEVSINKASFDTSVSKDDFFDNDGGFIKEMLSEDDMDIEF